MDISSLSNEIDFFKNKVDNFKTGEELYEIEESELSKRYTRSGREEMRLVLKDRSENFNLKGANVLQLGLDKIGQEMVKVLEEAGAIVLSFDAFSENSDYTREEDINVGDFDLITATHWFPPGCPLLQKAREKDVLIFSQLQLAQKIRVKNRKTNEDVNWIVVAGTNGKTQVVNLTKMILNQAGFNVNGEESILEAAKNAELDFVVVEADSYNLEFCYSLRPSTSALLNISAVDSRWHGDENDYIQALKNVYENTTKTCIFNADDFAVDMAVQTAEVEEGARAIGFTFHAPARGQIGFAAEILADRAFYENNTDPLRFLNAQEIVNFSNLKNLHNKHGVIPTYTLQNLAAAVAITRTYSVNSWEIYDAVSQFTMPDNINELVWHRELNKESKLGFGSIDYICDSNSKTPGATLGTANSYPERSVVLIVIGEETGADYTTFVKRAERSVNNLIIIGNSQSHVYKAAVKDAPGLPRVLIDEENYFEGLKVAFKKANELVFENQSIIFSPSTPLNTSRIGVSELSDYFKELVNELKNECHNKGVIAGVISE